MECENCGATLREGARFCNKCGAAQGVEPGGSSRDTPAGAPASAPSASSGDASTSGRARRPPRVPRATDVAEASTTTRARTVPVATDILDAAASAAMSQDAAAASADSASALAEPELSQPDAPDADEANLATPDAETSASPEATDQPSDAASDAEAPVVASAPPAEPGDEVPTPVPAIPAAEATGSAPEDASAAGAPASTSDWEDADTKEYSAVVQRGQSLDAIPATPQPTDMPALDELARSKGDAMPWPLPEHIIVGGRYRVEEALATVPDTPGAENVYRVRDLQGYEQCWSCGAAHGASAASDRFCQECGADMLSRDFLMYERRQQGERVDAPAGDTAEATEATEAERIFTQAARVYRVVPRVEEPPLFPRGVRVVAALAMDTGASRAGEENEDSAGIFSLNVAHDSLSEPLTLCVVADGLGGHASGQDASRLAVRILTEHILRTVALPHITVPVKPGADAASFEAGLIASLKAGVEAANAAICARNAATGADMGSTCVAALIYRDTAYFVNAGDSRGYVLEDEGLRRITTDHSLVEQLIAGGLISPEERYTHPQRNQIFRSLGDEPNVTLDTFTQKLRPGMRLLLCSDGLWEMVRDDEMAHILRETVSPQQACNVLISTANEHGGEDNISAVLVDISA